MLLTQKYIYVHICRLFSLKENNFSYMHAQRARAASIGQFKCEYCALIRALKDPPQRMLPNYDFFQ